MINSNELSLLSLILNEEKTSIFEVKKAILVTQNYHLDRAVYLGNALGVQSYGFIADEGVYNQYKYNSVRECFAIVKSLIDVTRNRKPRFLGPKVPISGLSNYTKAEK